MTGGCSIAEKPEVPELGWLPAHRWLVSGSVGSVPRLTRGTGRQSMSAGDRAWSCHATQAAVSLLCCCFGWLGVKSFHASNCRLFLKTAVSEIFIGPSKIVVQFLVCFQSLCLKFYCYACYYLIFASVLVDAIHCVSLLLTSHGMLSNKS